MPPHVAADYEIIYTPHIQIRTSALIVSGRPEHTGRFFYFDYFIYDNTYCHRQVKDASALLETHLIP